jgi:ribonuclease T2
MSVAEISECRRSQGDCQMRLGFVLVAAMVVLAGPAHAEVKLSGSFVADRACPATQSVKAARNPGNVATEAGRSYDLLAGNKAMPTHYLIEVPGAEPDRRWVKVTCGHLADGGATESPAGAAPETPAASADGKPEYVFALSWQPAFCETKPDKSECRAQAASGFDATHFSLHGLWPQPNGNFYCGVKASDRANDKPGRWSRLPAVTLDAATRQELDRVMPGTRSDLERHEWIKHGTCSGKSQQDYFADAVRLLREVNASPVQALFAKSVGSALTSGQIRDAFDAAFGAGAGERVRVSCVNDHGRRLIGEITLGLTGPIEPASSLSGLMLAAAPTDNAGCPEGTVDAVGVR